MSWEALQLRLRRQDDQRYKRCHQRENAGFELESVRHKKEVIIRADPRRAGAMDCMQEPWIVNIATEHGRFMAPAVCDGSCARPQVIMRSVDEKAQLMGTMGTLSALFAVRRPAPQPRLPVGRARTQRIASMRNWRTRRRQGLTMVAMVEHEVPASAPGWLQCVFGVLTALTLGCFTITCMCATARLAHSARFCRGAADTWPAGM
jgi:hypothetical protein